MSPTSPPSPRTNYYDEHESCSQLCAISVTRELTTEESLLLRRHLGGCPQCQQDLRRYREIAANVMPVIASTLPHQSVGAELAPVRSGRTSPTDENSEIDLAWWPKDRAKEKLLQQAQAPPAVAAKTAPLVLPRPNWNRRLLSAAAALIIAAGGAVAGYQLSRVRRSPVSAGARAPQLAPPVETATPAAPGANQQAELENLTVLLDRQKKTIGELTATVQSLQEHSEREAREAKDRASQLGTEKTAHAAEAARLSEQLTATNDQLVQAQSDYTRLQSEYATLKTQFAQKDLELQNASARAALAESAVDRQQQLLASDRDIRDLMGARDLLIADVFDLDRDGHKQQPFGRIFYTKKKSLIFYAFDLDQQQHGPREASFQAWGIHGDAHAQPLSLGILYLDNETNKRWALRIEDPDQLAQLQAVFVTVEPKGGSRKPTGRQLLYASLRREPNHP
jgi:hypothetical protein